MTPDERGRMPTVNEVMAKDRQRIHEHVHSNELIWIYEPNLDAAQYAAWSNQICYNCSRCLEHTDVVANALFLVLRNTLGYPSDVTDFLSMY